MRTVIDRILLSDWRDGVQYIDEETPVLIERVRNNDGRGAYYSPGQPGGGEPDINKAPVYHVRDFGSFNSGCHIILFTEETKEQFEARLAAFTPMQRLFYELGKSPTKTTNPGISVESFNALLVNYASGFRVASLDGIPNYVLAALICLSGDVRNLIPSAQRSYLDAMLLDIARRIKEIGKQTPASSKIWNAFHNDDF